MTDSIKHKIKVYAVFIIGTLIVGAVSGFLGMGGMMKFADLQKPPLSPPAVVFMVVWTVLYILMGISAAIIYLTPRKNRDTALIIYIFQLIFNFFWTIFFFTFEWRLFAFFWLLALLGLVIIMIVRFFGISKIAAILQIPYALWLCFAAYLNIAIYALNG